MTPSELARLHSSLWHVTCVDAVQSILDRGLLSTADILDRWEVAPADRERYLAQRRPKPVMLRHPEHGSIVINDNAPLSETKLEMVLDDRLLPADWLTMLNNRVFFFADHRPLNSFKDARLNRSNDKKVLVIDTMALAEAYGHVMEIVPFNSGNTHYAAVRRGKSSFSPLLETQYPVWRRQRGNKTPDRIKEVAVRGSIPNISRFVTEIRDGGIVK